MLRIRRATDHAFVVLAALATEVDPSAPTDVITARSVSEATGLPQPTVAKVLKILARSALVESTRGLCGGYRLARGPAHITVAEVVEAVEGPVALTGCAVPELIDCEHTGSCAMSPHWPRINAAVVSALSAVTLAELFGLRPTPAAEPPASTPTLATTAS